MGLLRRKNPKSSFEQLNEVAPAVGFQYGHPADTYRVRNKESFASGLPFALDNLYGLSSDGPKDRAKTSPGDVPAIGCQHSHDSRLFDPGNEEEFTENVDFELRIIEPGWTDDQQN